MHMIWKSTNPSKNVLCDTYIVMKWLAQWWNVKSSNDPKSAYRAEAVSRNQLEGCKKWFYVRNINL
jgi:hypothetical protein